MYYPALLLVLAPACLGACDSERSDVALAEEPALRAAPPAAAPCEVVRSNMTLPEAVRETSGLARSVHDPDMFWTHNDAGNEPEIFAIGAGGELVRRVQVAGAQLVDWEDIEAAPCGTGACLYIGDIGDNDGDRQHITIYRVAEPPAGASVTGPAEPLHARFPDGPRDAEALFADRTGNLYIVTKGRQEEIALYRYPAPLRPGETATLEHVRQLFPAPHDENDRVTSATATPDGRWVGIRTYDTLYVYAGEELTGRGAAEPMVVDLSALGEPQGESLVMADDGSVWTSSEAEDDSAQPRWSHLQCVWPDE